MPRHHAGGRARSAHTTRVLLQGFLAPHFLDSQSFRDLWADEGGVLLEQRQHQEERVQVKLGEVHLLQDGGEGGASVRYEVVRQQAVGGEQEVASAISYFQQILYDCRLLLSGKSSRSRSSRSRSSRKSTSAGSSLARSTAANVSSRPRRKSASSDFEEEFLEMH